MQVVCNKDKEMITFDICLDKYSTLSEYNGQNIFFHQVLSTTQRKGRSLCTHSLASACCIRLTMLSSSLHSTRQLYPKGPIQLQLILDKQNIKIVANVVSALQHSKARISYCITAAQPRSAKQFIYKKHLHSKMSLAQVWKDNLETSLKEAVLAAYATGLEQGLPRTQVIEEILALAGNQWRAAKAYIPVLAYALDDERQGCQTDDYGTVVDPITLEEIPLERLISFQEGGKKWCFDIESLFEYVERGQALNPLTRQKLPPEVQAQILAYKEREREVIVHIHVEESIPTPIRDMEVKFNKGFPMVELVVNIFRAWKESRGAQSLSAPELLSKYMVPVEDWEELVSNARKLTITDPKTSTLSLSEKATYYENLTRALEKRSSLQGFVHFALLGRDNIFKEMNFLQSAAHLEPWEGYAAVMAPPDGSPFTFLKKESDYFRPLRELSASVESWRPRYILDSFLELYQEPERDQSITQEQRSLLYSYLGNTINYLFRTYATEKNFAKTKETMQFILHYGTFWTIKKNILLLIDNFSPEQAYELLKGKVHATHLRALKVSPEFKDSIYYYLLLGMQNEADAQAMLDFVRTGTTPVTDPVLLADMVGLLGEPQYYFLLQDRLDYPTLYEYIVNHELYNIDAVLPEERRLERYFRKGGQWTELPFFKIKEYVAQLLEKGIDEIYSHAFTELIGDPEKLNLSPEEVFAYLLLATKRENLFLSLMSSLANLIFLQAELDLSTKEYMQVYCWVASSKEISEDLKSKGFEDVVLTDLPTYAQLLQDLYACMGLERAIRLYRSEIRSSFKKKEYIPQLTKENLQQLMESDLPLLVEIMEQGLW